MQELNIKNRIISKSTYRIEYVDLSKGIAIFLMVLCHTGVHNHFTQWVYAFHMPLFFIVSGMLFKNTSFSLKEYSIKKIKQLLVPYFLFAMILCFGTNSYFDWIKILYASRNSLSDANVSTPLWFLPCFFISSIFFMQVNKIGSRYIKVLVLLILFVLGCLLSNYTINSYRWPFNIDVAFVGVILMTIGQLVNKVNINPLMGGGIFSNRIFVILYEPTK